MHEGTVLMKQDGNLPMDEIVVADIAGAQARIYATQAARDGGIAALGFVQEHGYFTLPVGEDDARISLITRLIALRAVFCAGWGWSPAELLDHYRQSGHVTGRFRVIAWTGPGQYRITER